MMLAFSQLTRISSARFLGLWVGANFLGGFLIGTLENNGLQFMATLVLSGAIVGSLQWAVLRSWGRGVRWWPIASALGWIVGVYLDTGTRWLYEPLMIQLGLPPSDEGFLLSLTLHGAIWTLGMAIGQCLVVRYHSRRWTGMWLLSSLVGGAGAAMISRGFCLAFCAALPRSLVGLTSGMGWAAYGLVTGLVWLCVSGRRSDPEETA